MKYIVLLALLVFASAVEVDNENTTTTMMDTNTSSYITSSASFSTSLATSLAIENATTTLATSLAIENATTTLATATTTLATATTTLATTALATTTTTGAVVDNTTTVAAVELSGDLSLSLVLAGDHVSAPVLLSVRNAVATVLHVTLNDVVVPSRRHLLSVLVLLSVRGASFQGNLKEALSAEFELRSLPTLLGVTTTTMTRSSDYYYVQQSRRSLVSMDYATPAFLGVVCLVVFMGAMSAVVSSSSSVTDDERVVLLRNSYDD